ncbi:MAG: hypothetical protein ACT4O6_18945 [Reyranella sp.]
MPAPAGYVGFTVLPDPVVRTCVQSYRPAGPPVRPPNVVKVYEAAANYVRWAQPGAVVPPNERVRAGFRHGFSFFEFIVQLNNLNGAKPVPAGHVIMARITTDAAREDPCGTPLPSKVVSYYEKFAATSIDIQAAFTGCDSRYCFQRTAEYGIVPDPTPANPVPNNEYADKFIATPAQITAFEQAVTLRLTWHWEYDNCTPPTQNVLLFTAETLDPANGGAVTWTLPGSPIQYLGSP